MHLYAQLMASGSRQRDKAYVKEGRIRHGPLGSGSRRRHDATTLRFPHRPLGQPPSTEPNAPGDAGHESSERALSVTTANRLLRSPIPASRTVPSGPRRPNLCRPFPLLRMRHGKVIHLSESRRIGALRTFPSSIAKTAMGFLMSQTPRWTCIDTGSSSPLAKGPHKNA